MPAPIAVNLVPHSPTWQADAQREAARLIDILSGNVIAVHHVGSTAIPGISAKPILDLIPEVRSLAELDSAEALITELGYQWWHEYGIAGRRYCTLDDPATGRRLIQLHCFQAGDMQIERMLAFRDFLRSRPEVAAAYEAEKQRCRALHPHDSHAYTDAKTVWIEAQIPLALAAFRSHC